MSEYYNNMMQLHLRDMLQKNGPWLQLAEIGNVSRRFAEAQRRDASPIELIKLQFKPDPYKPPVMKDAEIQTHVHAMCREGVMAVCQRVDFSNYKSIAHERYGQTEAGDNVATIFRTLIEQGVKDERVHVYRATIIERPDDNDQDGEEECYGCKDVVKLPEGVIPAPVPNPADGTRGTGGGRPVWTPGWA